MDDMMHTRMTYTSLQKIFFAKSTMAIYGDHSVAQYVFSLYTSRVLLILSYISGVSVSAEKSQHIYIHHY